MLTVKYTKLAIKDLTVSYEYICAENPISARFVIEKIETALTYLQMQPYLGHVGRVKNTYEFIVLGTPFIVVYMLKEDSLIVVSILHTAKKYP